MIPLADAVLLWGRRGDAAAFKVESRARMIAAADRGSRLDSDFESSAGAVNLDWQEASGERRLAMLFAEVVTIFHRDGVPFDRMHRALLAVPEYADLLAEDAR